MVTVIDIRAQLDVKIFNDPNVASDATMVNVSAQTYNTRGDLETSTETNVAIKVVPYNYFTSNLSHQAFGELNDGESDVVLRYDTSVTQKDKFTLLGETYEVQRVEDYILGNSAIAKVMRVKKLLPV